MLVLTSSPLSQDLVSGFLVLPDFTCVQKPLCCSSLSWHAWDMALPGAQRCRPSSRPAPSTQRFPVFAVALALPKRCCCPVGTGAACCFWSEPEGDVPTACTQVWLMMVELSTCLFLSLLPVSRENRCFLNRGADGMGKMWFVLVSVWGFLLLLFLFFIFSWKSRKMLNHCVQN